MIKKFSFDKVREDVRNKDVLVIQGYTNEAFLHSNSIEVSFVAGSRREKVMADTITEKLLPVFAVVRGGRPLSYMMYVRVKLTDSIKAMLGMNKGGKAASGYMTVTDMDDNGRTTQLYKTGLSFVKTCMNRVSYAIDDIEKKDGTIAVSGWAVDAEEVRIGLYKTHGKRAERIPSTVEWTFREDVTSLISECDSTRKCGFKLTAETQDEHLKLLIQTRRKKKIINLKSAENSSKATITNRIAQCWYTVEYNINTIGFRGTARKIVNKLTRGMIKSEIDYNKWRLEHIPDDEALKLQREEEAHFSIRPKFSIVIPMYETEERLIDELIESVQAETYTNWELCFSDGSRDKSRLRDIIKKYSANDDRIRYIADEASSETLGIAENTNQAIKAATGDYIVFGDHDDLFAPDALFECAKLINAKEEKIHAMYTDEDKVDSEGKVFSMPNFKPDFNIDYLRSVNYICHMFVISRELCDAVGLLDPEYNGAQDYDYILRCADKLDEWNREGDAAAVMHHIAKPLYHWRIIEASTANNPKAKLYAFDNGKKAIEAHLKRRGLEAVVEMGEDLGYYDVHYKSTSDADTKHPVLSIIIPNKDHIADLKKCIDSIEERSTFRDYEFVIVENNSTEPETFEYYKELEERDNVQVVTWEKGFNYSAINNFGAQFAKGDFFLLLNNDTELLNDDAIEDMLGFCRREDVGAVGARLYYEDDTVQHAGVIVGIGGIAGHCFQRQPEVPGEIYFNRSKMSADYSAVTAACLMVRREVFEKISGLDESFEVAFNDIDFCLRIRELGLLVVYDAWARFHHYESKSRGYEDSIEKKERFRREISRLQQKWTGILTEGDPYYNPNLTLEKQDFSLRF